MQFIQPLWPAYPELFMLIALCVALMVGAVNGALVTYAGIQPIIVTLVTLVMGRGLAQTLTHDQKVGLEIPAFEFIGNGTVLGLPFPALLVAGVALCVGLLLRKTATGIAAATVEAPVEVTIEAVLDALGRQKFFREAAERTAVPGVATGLAVAVSIPVAFAKGDGTWTITNGGDAPVSGTWSDALYLSADATISTADTLVANNTTLTVAEPSATYTLSVRLADQVRVRPTAAARVIEFEISLFAANPTKA